MKHELLSGIMEKVLVTVGGAALIAGGGTMISNTRTNAVQDAQLVAIAATLGKIDKIDEKTSAIAKDVAVMDERLRRAIDDPRQ